MIETTPYGFHILTPPGSLKTVASDTLGRLRKKSESVQGGETGPEALQGFTEAFEERLAVLPPYKWSI